MYYLVKAAPILKSNFCRTSTARLTRASGCAKVLKARSTETLVISENLARIIFSLGFTA